MFASLEEQNKALEALNDSINSFNAHYNVKADVSVFEGATDKKSANKIFIDTFKNLLKQAIQSENPNQMIRIVSMRSAFEREVVGPYRSYSLKKANENELASVQKTLPDVDAGLHNVEWWRQLDKNLDDIYWEKIDRVADSYKKGAPRIRDMLAETRRILQAQGEISKEDVQKLAGYAAALRRANEGRSGIWKFLQYFRGKAEQRESANIEKMLNERLGDPDAYRSALKEITDPTGRIGRLKEEAGANQNLKLDLSAVSNEKAKNKSAEKKQESKTNEEKVQLIVEDIEKPSASMEKEKVPGNDRLYRLIGDKSFVEKIKDDIWRSLKLKETLTLDKNTAVEPIYSSLLKRAESVNEDRLNLLQSDAKPEALEEYAEEAANSMFTEAYLNLESFHMEQKDRVVAAQKIADTMLKELTAIGFEKDTFGKYGESYAVKNETAVIELLQFDQNPLSEEAIEYVLNASKKELSAVHKERVDFAASGDSQKKVPVSEKSEMRPTYHITFNK